ENFLQMVQSGYIEGMIAIDNIGSASVSEIAEMNRIPTVSVGYPRATYWIRCNDFAGGKRLFSYLYELGHRRMGLITIPNEDNLAVNERMNGVREAALEHAMQFEDFPVAFGDFST